MKRVLFGALIQKKEEPWGTRLEPNVSLDPETTINQRQRNRALSLRIGFGSLTLEVVLSRLRRRGVTAHNGRRK